MRITFINIDGFGPLVNRKFTFVSRLNVVHGPNEAAKSALHGALFAGICGLRRGQGQPKREDKLFAQRHRPWDGSPWRVVAFLELEDGRRIRLTQELSDIAGSKAEDDSNGESIASEIQFDGGSDGAMLLGLNRRSFRAIACVRQGEIVAALANDDDHHDDFGALQHSLQLAATSASQRDETAGAALRALKEFWTEHVGRDDGRSAKRPYRHWKTQVEARRQVLTQAREAHEHYVALLQQRDDAERIRDESDRSIRLAEASIANAEAAALETRHQRATHLAVAHPAAPTGVSGEQGFADRVSTALALWESAPAAPALTGKTSAEIQAEIDELPEPPVGDLIPDQSVTDAVSALDAVRALKHQEQDADHAAAPVGSVPPVAAPTIVWSRARAPMIGVFIFGIAGVAAIVAGAAAIGAALLVAAFAAAAATFWFLRPAEVAQIAAAVPVSGQREQGLERRINDAETTLEHALAARGVARADPETLDHALARYRTECQRRAAIDQRARARPELELALGTRRQEEHDAKMRASAVEALREAAVPLDLDPQAEADVLAGSLRNWQDQRQSKLGRHDAEQAEWAELQELLGDGTLADLHDQQAAARAKAAAAAQDLSQSEVAAADPTICAEELPNLRAEHQALVAQSARISQQAETDGAKLKPVAEAEAELEDAEAALERVTALDNTLNATIDFLAEAQKQIYASIAPTLTATLEKWLPRVVVSPGPAGVAPRYWQATVDPKTLDVRVREDESLDWHTADDLSTGTREQIYLLLRVALAQHLVKEGEVTPLLLDEVTAQCDAIRRAAVLDLLLELSDERQIILFTHDDAVLDWARSHLESEAITQLGPINADDPSTVVATAAQ